MPDPDTDDVKAAGLDESAARSARIGAWRMQLLGAVRLEERLQLLSALGLTDGEIARAIPGGKARSVRRWRLEGVAVVRLAGRWAPIDDLCAIVCFLLSDGTYDEEGVVAWLRSRSPELRQARPLDALGEGRFIEVFDAAELIIGPGPYRSGRVAVGPLAQAAASTDPPARS